MYLCYIVLISFAISPAVSAAVTNLASSTSRRNLTEATVSQRSKRQAGCGTYRWRCADGTCIPVDGKCDGKYDCPDNSDETHALCRNNRCQRNWFRCTYGACVDGTAPCNGVVECVDQSDELLPRCRKQSRVLDGKFRCLDGNAIPAPDVCDGVPSCPDGSDETVAACAGQVCPVHLFQCAYGACVDQGSDCNGRNDCADGSDESAELCNRILPANTSAVSTTDAIDMRHMSGSCLLPPYPEHGRYVVTNSPESKPGQSLQFALLSITCETGFNVVGDTSAYCQDGNWQPIPKCVRHCKLDHHISVKYHCSFTVGEGEGTRPCKEYEPPGTRVEPECNPNYFSTDLLYMTCYENGVWNRIVTCKPECGRVTPTQDGLIFGGNTAKRGELPWYVAIYRKPNQLVPTHEQICGGTIVSNRIVISAGHCFYNDFGAEEASRFAVATAKLFREWDNKNDIDVQKSDIKQINFTERYFGARANQQQDIAILTLETPFRYFSYVRRVCLDFSPTFNELQLQNGNLGKVAGFGLAEAQATEGSPVLKVVSLPYVPIKQCRKLTPETFVESLSGDKICAGYNNGKAALCKGDSGGGLTFPAEERGITRYYLRGIVSTAPRSEHACNTFTVITFTSIIEHERFINKFL